MNPPAVLRIEDLSIGYTGAREEVLAIRDVSLSVEPGAIIGIAGESGSGKSTLAASILRLPDSGAVVRSGRILLRDVDLASLGESEMSALRGRDVAMIFQDPFTALNPVLTIGAQLIDVQHRSGISKSMKRRGALSALEQVGIDDAELRLGQHPHQLSGGMLQRVCIAMALLVKPALLIADEPTTALDATTEVQILDLLRQFQQSTGAAILLVSHHLNAIAALCRRIVIMYAGEIVEEGEVPALFENPRHPYTRLLIECDPARITVRSRELPSIPGIVARVTGRPRECVFSKRCPQAYALCSEAAPRTAVVEGRRVKCHLSDDGHAARDR